MVRSTSSSSIRLKAVLRQYGPLGLLSLLPMARQFQPRTLLNRMVLHQLGVLAMLFQVASRTIVLNIPNFIRHRF